VIEIDHATKFEQLNVLELDSKILDFFLSFLPLLLPNHVVLLETAVLQADLEIIIWDVVLLETAVLQADLEIIIWDVFSKL
jgi:hypothetical protein